MSNWQKIVGSYDTGLIDVQIVAREGRGAEFYLNPNKGEIPRIKIGIDWPEWKDCIDELVHETMELALTLRGYRYSKAPDLGFDHAGYHFLFNHEGLSECARMVSAIICLATQDLSVIYRNRRKNKND